MTLSQREAEPYSVPVTIYARLEKATPAERAAIVLALIAEQPEGRLILPERDGRRAHLRGVALSDVQLGQADLRGADLREAHLAGAFLAQADLAGALLEGANLSGADLVGATLRGAALSEVNLQDALLEDANLLDATLRFANLRSAALENANLRRADLWGAMLEDAILTDANLQGARIGEAFLHGADLSGADLRECELGQTDLGDARLTGADLRGAAMNGARLHGATLSGARLQDLDLSTCDLTHISLAGAWLDKTRFQGSQLAGSIGEEDAGNYDLAVTGYLALERNFVNLGEADAARWAYRKKRRMQKLAARQRGRLALDKRDWRAVFSGYAQYAGDQIVEWVCDYGESVPRVLGSLLATYVLFTVFYGLTGGVTHVTANGHGSVTNNPADLALFSLLVMTYQTSIHLLPSGEWMHVPMGLEVLAVIFLTGLMGFVAGNRIRR